MNTHSWRKSNSGFALSTFIIYVLRQLLALRQSFWFIPTLSILFCAALALASLELDNYFIDKDYPLSAWINNLEPTSAKGLLEVIATAVITITSIAFSITLVVLTTASQQFGPRLLANFIKDRRNQFVLGVFTATFVYCLIILRGVRTDPSASFLPGISVSIALILALFSVFTLIYFFHHIAISIQADTVIRRTSDSLKSDINAFIQQFEDKLFLGSTLVDDQDLHCKQVIHSTECAYVQAINYEGLCILAAKHACVFKLSVRAGHHVIQQSALLEVLVGKDENRSIDVTQEEVENCFIFGSARTSLQDPEFAINQLVELALRALSPGINDPHTAIHCVHALTENFSLIVDKQIARGLLTDDRDALRVITRQPTFDGMLGCAFNQIRQQSLDHNSVQIALLDGFNALLALLFTLKENQSLSHQNADAVIKQGIAVLKRFDKKKLSQLEYESFLSRIDQMRVYAEALSPALSANLRDAIDKAK
uniref:DUF2254 domain-containing protein n=1 Tax=Ningiella ruwaisensis TaxID=2364274 RepID=UPI0010A0A584|nr:DUF2254 domain-containing protein [Ningiella ruwaisensis]